VGVDIFLQDGQLRVGHDWRELHSERTLQSLYLNPPRLRARQNRGAIYPNAPFFQLLIDIKSDWQSIYPVLRHTLEQYTDLITEKGSLGGYNAPHFNGGIHGPPRLRVSVACL